MPAYYITDEQTKLEISQHCITIIFIIVVVVVIVVNIFNLNHQLLFLFQSK
jgi:preprotein translocase subunit Sec61beta